LADGAAAVYVRRKHINSKSVVQIYSCSIVNHCEATVLNMHYGGDGRLNCGSDKQNVFVVLADGAAAVYVRRKHINSKSVVQIYGCRMNTVKLLS
jgi:hypothetical protein